MYTDEKPSGLFETLKARANAETPLFFKKLRLLGLAMVAAGVALIATPVYIPALFIQTGNYLVLAGIILTVVSQLTVKDDV